MSQPERNTTVNAGPPIEPVPSIGARVAVHAWPFLDGEHGTVTAARTDRAPTYMVALDSDGQSYAFWPGELRTINA